MPGVLYVVATPIGNLEDITLRALRVLKQVDRVVAEDTREAHKLLAAHQITAPLSSYHAHSSDASLASLVARLEAGENLAFITDAGTPLVSDPGDRLVIAALAAGAQVVPLPGASAVLTALMGAALPPQPFLFLGFLPRNEADRREVLAPLKNSAYTLVIYEAANRVPETLASLLNVLGDRPACLARELTKKFETFDRATLAELSARHQTPPLGEVVLVIGPGHAEAPSRDPAKEAEQLLASGMKASEAAKVLAGSLGLTKQDAYQYILDVQKKSKGD